VLGAHVSSAGVDLAFLLLGVHCAEALAILEATDGDRFALLSKMSDVELAYVRRVLMRHRESPLTPAERHGAVDVMLDLATGGSPGDIPINVRERRAAEGWWGFLNLLRSFAAANGLPTPAIEHGIHCPYDQQVIRDLFERYGLTTTTPGVPLSDWALEDRDQLLAVWHQVNVQPPQSSRPQT
jgi:hypothetical protein